MGSSHLLPYRPGTTLSCQVPAGMTEFTLSFPAGQHLSSYNSATTVLQEDLYLQVNTNLIFQQQQQHPHQGKTLTPRPRVTEKPPVVFPQARLSPRVETLSIFSCQGLLEAAAAAEAAMSPGRVGSCHPFPGQLLLATSSRCEPAHSS